MTLLSFCFIARMSAFSAFTNVRSNAISAALGGSVNAAMSDPTVNAATVALAVEYVCVNVVRELAATGAVSYAVTLVALTTTGCVQCAIGISPSTRRTRANPRIDGPAEPPP